MSLWPSTPGVQHSSLELIRNVAYDPINPALEGRHMGLQATAGGDNMLAPTWTKSVGKSSHRTNNGVDRKKHFPLQSLYQW